MFIDSLPVSVALAVLAVELVALAVGAVVDYASGHEWPSVDYLWMPLYAVCVAVVVGFVVWAVATILG